LNTLKLSKVEAEMPISGTRFFREFMRLAVSPGMLLEVKDTSYKNLDKFYRSMEKEGLIEYKHSNNKKG
jgi:hypothetical protein